MTITLFKHLSSAMLIVMIMCSPIVLLAQSPKIAFEKYGVEEGLPEEVALNFIQDRQGFIWIGTQNGLVKFDGYTMKVYRSNPEDPNALHLQGGQGGLFLARDGKIWMAGYGNTNMLSSFDPETGNFTNFPIDFGDITDVEFTDLLMEDIAKQIWFFGTSNANTRTAIFKLDPSTGHVTQYPFEVRDWPLNSIVLNGQFAESKTDSSLWLNTTDGNLHRYDRKKDVFELNFKAGDILPGTMLRDSIQAITPAGKSGLIPMGNNQNVYLWDPQAGQVVESYHFPHREAISWRGAAFEDEYKNLWVSSGSELTRINRKTNTNEDFIFGQGRLTFAGAPEDITRLLPLFQNQEFILFGVYSNNDTRLTFLRFNFLAETFDFFDERFNDIINVNQRTIPFSRFLVDHSGLLWRGTRPNLYKQSPKSRQIERFEHDSNDKYSLPAGTVTLLFEDSRQRLWIGLSTGIALKVGPEKFQQISWFEGNQNGESLGAIQSIMEDSNGQIWAGSENGLFRWSESKFAFQKIQLGFKETNPVTAITEDKQGRLWISITDKGVYLLNAVSAKILQRFESDNSTRHLLKSTTITGIFEDAKGQVWLWDRNRNDYGLFRFIESEGRFVDYSYTPGDTKSIRTNRILFITEDDRGKIWLGTGVALYLYESDTDLFIGQNNRVLMPLVSGFSMASNGKMWFKTYSGFGLALVGPGINNIQIFGEEQGMLHNDATGYGELAVDDFGRLWLPTMRGISVFDTVSHTFNNYDKEDGYLQYSRNSFAYRTKDGDIWIGSEGGLYRAVPANLIKKDTTPPKVWITAMGIMDSDYAAQDGDIFEKAVSFTQRIELQHWQKDIRFEFVALHYLRSKDNQYSWKLENYDKDWTNPSTSRQAAYTNLSPGTYTFRVKASNADGVWNEDGASITIIILPPWWQTWWAYLIYILMFLIVLRSFSLYRERRLREEKEQLQVKVDERTSELAKKSEELTHSLEDLKSTQSQLIQQEKLASLGQLTAGIAHEIKNPLNFVNNFSDVSLEMIDEALEELGKTSQDDHTSETAAILADIKSNLAKIHEHGSRADSIVKAMLMHSRGGNGKMEPVNLNELVKEYVNLSYHGMRAGKDPIEVDIDLQLDESIGEIPLIAEDFSRVILNLCTNAFDACTERSRSAFAEHTIGSSENLPQSPGGSFESLPQSGSPRRVPPYTPRLAIRTGKTNGTITIEIEDNGPGIPDEIKDKILQPFFTTKKGTQGTGLGLSITNDIIKAHGGRMDINSTPGVKTTFTIYLEESH